MEQQQEWQPKWGEEVEVSDDEKEWWGDWLYVGKHPISDEKNPTYIVAHKDDLDIGDSYPHIRPIPPKPKTFREEVEELKESSNYAVYTVAINDVLAIIDRHEKGATNE